MWCVRVVGRSVVVVTRMKWWSSRVGLGSGMLVHQVFLVVDSQGGVTSVWGSVGVGEVGKGSVCSEPCRKALL